ncbi:hypothetical protein QYM36_007597 [Artemia franciscana]|uniref:Uncharacterized protein n=1 Tax=Artemia franciscana TaxID=6661 RepID=A0AA88IDU3_ARTSF|nr:hypothetical protein QYM36_007597 [Artemia franciscana]
MATAEEDAQRVYAKKLAADRESKKRKRAEESKEQKENRFAADRESKKRKHLQAEFDPRNILRSEIQDIIISLKGVVVIFE